MQFLYLIHNCEIWWCCIQNRCCYSSSLFLLFVSQQNRTSNQLSSYSLQSMFKQRCTMGIVFTSGGVSGAKNKQARLRGLDFMFIFLFLADIHRLLKLYWFRFFLPFLWTCVDVFWPQKQRLAKLWFRHGGSDVFGVNYHRRSGQHGEIFCKCLLKCIYCF